MILLVLGCGGPDFAEALRTGECGALENPDDRGLCALRAGTPCEQIEAGTWQQECWFEAAERADDPALCARTGDFAQECWSHLWKPRAEALLRPDGDVAAMTREAEALALSFDPQFQANWGWWWRRIHEVAPAVDLGRCAGLEHADLRRCEREGVSALESAWRLRARDFCRADSLVGDDPDLAWVPHPTLDPVAARVVAQACRR